MVAKLTCLLLLTALITISNGDVSFPPPEPIISTTEIPPTSPSTTTQPPTTKTTLAPKTTTVPPKTTTVPPSTTTIAPTTPSTTEIPTTSAAPITTSAPPTPSPRPVDPPETGKWWYTKNNETCIVIEMAIQLNVTYPNKDNKTVFVLIDVPANTTSTVDGSCGNDTQSIKVQWLNNTAQWSFTKVENTSDYTLSQMLFNVDSNSLINAKESKVMSLYYTGPVFTAPLSNSYHCARIQKLNLTNSAESNVTVSTVQVCHVQVDAFRTEDSHNFSTASDCEIIDTPDIVPIAVGCALAALVIIVLIAYLVGRRRSQARGYLSM